MRRWLARLSLASLVAVAALATSAAAQDHGTLAGLHVPFVTNQGQVDARVAYYAPTFVGTLFVTQQGELV